MLLGIDIGGTYSDGILISPNKEIDRIKVKTNSENLIESILEIKTQLKIKDKDLNKIIVSTTLMTNFITERKYKNIGLLLIPGPGINYKEKSFPFPFKIIKGGVDFQGRIFEKYNEEEVYEKVDELIALGIQKISVNCKFSPRNPELENEVYFLIKKKYPHIRLEKGIDLNGSLNFIRRATSSALTLASEEVFTEFVNSLKIVFSNNPEIYLLKSDGGAIPIEEGMKNSIETIFSGPAASSFGALALMKDIESSLVIDMGGTTCDFSLILNREPLFATKGIKINDFYTTAKGLSVYSFPLGGDTKVDFIPNGFLFSYKKALPTMNGGSDITISDCLCYLKEIEIGDWNLAKDRLEIEANKLGISPEELSLKIVNEAGKMICETLLKVISFWEREPKYRVWQIENQLKIHPEQIFLIGGPAKAMKKYIENNSNIPVVVDKWAMTANALGAALAKDSFNSYIRINTNKNEVVTGWGEFKKTTFSKKIHPEEAATFALELTKEYLKKLNISESPLIFEHEMFSMVKMGYTEGQIHEFQVGLQPGINLDLLPELRGDE